VFAKIWSGARSIPEEEAQLFFLHIDECQRFINLPQSLDRVLFEARKYKLCLMLAHPFISRLTGPMRIGLSEGTQNKFAFKLGSGDAKLAAPDFSGVTPDDITGLQHREFIAKVLKDRNSSAPFSGKTLEQAPVTSNPDSVRVYSQNLWARPASIVDADTIKRQSGNGMGGGGTLKFGREDPEDPS
jgi:hypothetical protein